MSLLSLYCLAVVLHFVVNVLLYYVVDEVDVCLSLKIHCQYFVVLCITGRFMLYLVNTVFVVTKLHILVSWSAFAISLNSTILSFSLLSSHRAMVCKFCLILPFICCPTSFAYLCNTLVCVLNTRH